MNARSIVTLLLALCTSLCFAPEANARWYDAKTGRWITRDPLDATLPSQGSLEQLPMILWKDGTALYQYVRSRPITTRDPMGLCPYPVPSCIRQENDAGNYEYAQELLREYQKRRPLWKLVECANFAVDVADEVAKGINVDYGIAEAIFNEGECCKDGKKHKYTATGTSLRLGAQLGISYRAGVKAESSECEDEGSHYRVLVGPSVKVEAGVPLKLKVQGGIHVLPGGEIRAFGTFNAKTALPVKFSLNFGSLIECGLKDVRGLISLAGEVGIGVGASVGVIETYSVSLEDTGQCCE
ncbi:MAG: hypothetical protein KDA20_05405 [Phycisphaerales bacterium]|nr:hypothetical protein [Phycisphaerales bacterium]